MWYTFITQNGVDRVEDGLCACIRNVETNGIMDGLGEIARGVILTVILGEYGAPKSKNGVLMFLIWIFDGK